MLRHHDLATDGLIEGHRIAWGALLDRLRTVIAGGDPGPDPVRRAGRRSVSPVRSDLVSVGTRPTERIAEMMGGSAWWPSIYWNWLERETDRVCPAHGASPAGELHVHCYRILGSVQDAEDALQNAPDGVAEPRELRGTSLVANLALPDRHQPVLEIACAANRRPQMAAPFAALHLPEPTSMGEVPWLEPYPDVLLTTISDHAPSPEARYSCSRGDLARIHGRTPRRLPTPPTGRPYFSDVLGFKAKEVAQILETTDESVTSALKRARPRMTISRTA